MPAAPVATIAIKAPLARYLAAVEGKPRGAARWTFKLMRALFMVWHQRFGVPARAWLRLGDRAIGVNCANTAFIDYAQRLRHDGLYEPEVTALFDHLAPLVGTVYDIGANWGYFSLVLARNPGFRGKIFAFEINPLTFADLSHCVAEAGVGDRVRCLAHGLSDHDGAARLARTRHSLLSRVLDETSSRTPGDAVAVRRLDALDLPPPDLIKLDVEGHEAAVLDGADATIRAAQPLIVMESWYRPDAPALMRQPLDWLEAAGYALHRLRAADEHLLIEPCPAADRAGISEIINVLGIPPSRLGLIEAAFRGGR